MYEQIVANKAPVVAGGLAVLSAAGASVASFNADTLTAGGLYIMAAISGGWGIYKLARDKRVAMAEEDAEKFHAKWMTGQEEILKLRERIITLEAQVRERDISASA